MRMKIFYAIVIQDHTFFYTKIDAMNQQDAFTYADIHWHDRVWRVYSSGAFWAYKKNHPRVQELPRELA